MTRAAFALLVTAAAAPAGPPGGTAFALVGPSDARGGCLSVELDGKPAAEVWAGGFAALFAYFDRDGSGHLDRTEAARLPAGAVLRQLAWGQVTPAPGGGPTWGVLDADRDGRVSRAEVEAFYRPRGVGTVVFAHARPAAPARLSAALWAKLDADADGKVSEAELAAAPKVLSPLDANGDELVSAAEMVGGLRYPGGAPAAVTEPGARVQADPDGKGPSLVPLRAPAGSAGETWTVRFGRRAGPTPERFTAVVPGGRWEVRVDPVPRAADEAAAACEAARRTLTESDADGDGKLAGVELERPAALGLKFLLPFADRDADGKLSRAELDAWLGLQMTLAAGVVVVGVTDLGPGLFEVLDADRDGVLSVRELRGAVARVRALGALGDGFVQAAALPRHAVAVVARGPVPAELVAPPRDGSAWFRAMDRNGDGDVSAAEFLGPAADFRRLDADGDGLIDPAEAGRAGAGK